jgi:hypothetical protein
LPPFLEERDAVNLGKHEIEHDHVVIDGGGFVVGFFAILGDIDGKALFFEALAKSPEKRLVILD